MEALSTIKGFDLVENWSLETALKVAKQFIYETGYFRHFTSGNPNWNIDLCFGDLSLLNMVMLLSFRGEQQSNLLVKDVFYGGEILDLKIYRFSNSQNNTVEFIWNDKAGGWQTHAAQNEFPFLDAKLSVHENILYTPFTNIDRSLSLTSMKLSYLRILNDQLRVPVSETGCLSAVVFVGIEEFKMAVVKKYSWGFKDGNGEILEMERDSCMVRDATGEERLLRYRPNRMVWIEE
ncbi:hypothetical protein ABW20_dc0106303 [Dactylellina cionopaga]|nr:hypothetical protein ABW20_dc0106303 [Dactylellina cionopaga]